MRTFFAWIMWLPVLAHAAPLVSINMLRGRAVTDPRGLIADVRGQLDHSAQRLDPDRERALLWGMGTAAINDNDDAALAEASLRLESLGQAVHDPVARAAAGFLRARHDIANGIGDGLGEALRAAAAMQDVVDPELTAWSRFQLCDAYTLNETSKKALPLCHKSEDSYRAIGDTWGVADAENDLGIALATLNRVPEAAAMYEHSRRDFRAIGAGELAVMVGDNLSQMYLKMGRVREALALSQTSLRHELAAGRISDSLGSSTDIARAEAALGHPRRAYEIIQATVARARAAGMNGELADLLETESHMAEKLGLLRPALADVREALKLNQSTSTPALRRVETELEQRYAAREKELRIRELEHDNRLKSLQLKAARAEAARRGEAQRQALLVGEVNTVAVIALLVVALLLYLLLRAQRRHAQELRLQARIDPLTGVENRRAFMERAEVLLARSRRAGDPSPLLMLIDFDHFKRINDAGGHPLGDRVLTSVAHCLGAHLDENAHLARIGGEEFAVLAVDHDGDGGLHRAERLREAVATLPLPEQLPMAAITVSIGVAMFDGVQCHDLCSWMREADAALYDAKTGGRDRVVACAMAS